MWFTRLLQLNRFTGWEYLLRMNETQFIVYSKLFIVNLSKKHSASLHHILLQPFDYHLTKTTHEQYWQPVKPRNPCYVVSNCPGSFATIDCKFRART